MPAMMQHSFFEIYTVGYTKKNKLIDQFYRSLSGLTDIVSTITEYYYREDRNSETGTDLQQKTHLLAQARLGVVSIHL